MRLSKEKIFQTLLIDVQQGLDSDLLSMVKSNGMSVRKRKISFVRITRDMSSK